MIKASSSRSSSFNSLWADIFLKNLNSKIEQIRQKNAIKILFQIVYLTFLFFAACDLIPGWISWTKLIYFYDKFLMAKNNIRKELKEKIWRYAKTS